MTNAHTEGYVKQSCAHEWVLIEGNPVVENTDICIRCHAIKAHTAPPCAHEWVLIEGNPVVENTDICIRCYAIKAHTEDSKKI